MQPLLRLSFATGSVHERQVLLLQSDDRNFASNLPACDTGTRYFDRAKADGAILEIPARLFSSHRACPRQQANV